MDDTPVVLGINRDRHASVCLMHGSHVQWAIQKERLTRHKHHPGEPGDMGAFYLPRLSGLERPLDVLVECHASGGLASEPANEVANEVSGSDGDRALTFARGARRARIPQHLAHVVGAFHPSPFREAAVMVVGGRGSPAADGRSEVASCHRVDRERIAPIGRQLREDGDRHAAGLGVMFQ